MDNFGLSDRICEMDEGDLYNMLDTEMEGETFDASKVDLENYEMSSDWLELFDDPVLNDKMMTDASDVPVVKVEHSYSIGKTSGALDVTSLVQCKTEPTLHSALDDNPGPAINPKFLELNTSDIVPTPSIAATTSATLCQKPRSIQTVTVSKQEPKVIFKNEPIVIEARRPTQQQSLLKPSTILLTKQSQPTTLSLQRLETTAATSHLIDNELDEGVYLNVMPMTPPGSGSDSESGLSMSPRQSPTPSPIRQVIFKSNHREINPATAIYSQPIPTSGVLVLTEEEKRTLISEGYPIPSKLPLSKIEEKNLKKVRRKIKNKISAQESRRKRKEYMDHLEKKMEDMTRENADLKKRCDKFEQSNQTLISQLHKLQTLLKKLTPPQGTAQTGICLMVLLLCFAVFFGDWIPSTLISGYGFADSTSSQPLTLTNTHSVDLYASTSYVQYKPSRTLLAATEDSQACGAEPWPVFLLRKSYECIASYISPDSLSPADTWANTSNQPLVVMTSSAASDSFINS